MNGFVNISHKKGYNRATMLNPPLLEYKNAGRDSDSGIEFLELIACLARRWTSLSSEEIMKSQGFMVIYM